MSAKPIHLTILKLFKKMYYALDMLENISRQLEADNSLIMQKEMLTQREAAIYMGVKQGRITNMINGKEVPVYRPTTNLAYIAKKDLDNYMKRNKLLSIYEMDTIANDYVRKKRKK